MADRPPPDREELEAAFKRLYYMYAESRQATAQVQAMVKALVDSLVATGVLPPHEYERRRERALEAKLRELAERTQIEISSQPDKYALTDLPQIDCAALMPICKAKCCTLRVTLSQQDIDEGIVSWDYERPYNIRRRGESNYCVYSDETTHACRVYANRPATCRRFDCRKDERIWKDFERRIPAD
jgi:Fe-S-cluster containining protein